VYGVTCTIYIQYNSLLSHLAHKVRLQISHSNEGNMWHNRHEWVLGHVLFGGVEEGAQDGDKELTAFYIRMS
jgi:hypothetical protein